MKQYIIYFYLIIFFNKLKLKKKKKNKHTSQAGLDSLAHLVITN